LTEVRRRITTLMLFRVVMITLVLGVTVALNVASPAALAAPAQVILFAIIAVTYGLTLLYAYLLPRVKNPLRFADFQLAGDLAITTVLVHVTGGAQSSYAFFYPLSIVGAAALRYRRGALVATLASTLLLVAISLAGWKQVLPTPPGVTPWDVPAMVVVRELMLNVGACLAIGVLAGLLGGQLKQSGERLALSSVRAADLAAFNQNVVRCLSSGLLTIDTEGTVVTANEVAAEILDRRAESLAGRPLAELLPQLAPLVAGLAAGEWIRRREITTTRPGGGELALGASVSPLTDHRGETIGRIVSFQDLTQLRRMEAQVKRAERLAVVGGVAAAVAHEIRNPLASISGSIELLASSPQASADDRQLMDIVLREVDRLNGLIGELLDYARPRERATMRVELAPLVEETLHVFAQDRSQTDVAVRLVRGPGGGEAWIEGDPARLRQVIWNLVRNAAEALDGGGGEVVVTVSATRDEVELVVADTGVGIAPEDQEHLFEPFFTRKARGTGLGLAIVHRVVTDHGGSVEVDSTPGRGTRMVVKLPLAAEPAKETPERGLARGP
jgi:two-component system, NtrC family, sensor histidine kinase PilS